MGFDENTLEIICPICQARLVSAELFVEHLEDSHLFADPEHWKSFKTSIEDFFSRNYDTLWRHFKVVRGPADSRCPYCGELAVRRYRRFFGSDCHDDHVDHHLSLLSKSGDVLVFRHAIARIIPYFVLHPIFNDIRGGRDGYD
jgi:DNA-directed RNA polymerase subunit RPC12/RpoP